MQIHTQSLWHTTYSLWRSHQKHLPHLPLWLYTIMCIFVHIVVEHRYTRCSLKLLGLLLKLSNSRPWSKLVFTTQRQNVMPPRKNAGPKSSCQDTKSSDCLRQIFFLHSWCTTVHMQTKNTNVRLVALLTWCTFFGLGACSSLKERAVVWSLVCGCRRTHHRWWTPHKKNAQKKFQKMISCVLIRDVPVPFFLVNVADTEY